MLSNCPAGAPGRAAGPAQGCVETGPDRGAGAYCGRGDRRHQALLPGMLVCNDCLVATTSPAIDGTATFACTLL
jgi:hypothetical protein